MTQQLMTLDQAIEQRLAELRQAELERERQLEEEARRREEQTQQALAWLCGYLGETEGIEIKPADFASAWMDGNGVIGVTYNINQGHVNLGVGIQYSKISQCWEIVPTVGRTWRATRGSLYADYDTFIDAVIYAGALKR